MTIISFAQFVKFAAALVFVLALMGGLALVMRRVNGAQVSKISGRRRLKIVESLPLDPRRRLVLLKRDDCEHLVILGTNGETVIETGIRAGQDEMSQRAGQNETG